MFHILTLEEEIFELIRDMGKDALISERFKNEWISRDRIHRTERGEEFDRKFLEVLRMMMLPVPVQECSIVGCRCQSCHSRHPKNDWKKGRTLTSTPDNPCGDVSLEAPRPMPTGIPVPGPGKKDP